MAKDVFISYSTRDKGIAERLCMMFEDLGLNCWIAPRDIAPGAEFDIAILEGIDQCQAMVIVLTAEANVSVFVKNEVNRAFSGGKPIFTFRFEDIKPAKALEFYLARHQWTDGFPPPVEEHIARMARALWELLGRPGQKSALEGEVGPERGERKHVPAGVQTSALVQAAPETITSNLVSGSPAARSLARETLTAKTSANGAESTAGVPDGKAESASAASKHGPKARSLADLDPALRQVCLKLIQTITFTHAGMGSFTDNSGPVFAELRIKLKNPSLAFAFLESILTAADETNRSLQDNAAMLLVKHNRNPRPDVIPRILYLMQTATGNLHRRDMTQGMGQLLASVGHTWPPEVRNEVVQCMCDLSQFDSFDSVRRAAINILAEHANEAAIDALRTIILTKQGGTSTREWNHAVNALTESKQPSAIALLAEFCENPGTDNDVLRGIAYWIKCHVYHTLNADEATKQRVVAGMKRLIAPAELLQHTGHASLCVLNCIDPQFGLSLCVKLLQEDDSKIRDVIMQGLSDVYSGMDTFWALVRRDPDSTALFNRAIRQFQTDNPARTQIAQRIEKSLRGA